MTIPEKGSIDVYIPQIFEQDLQSAIESLSKKSLTTSVSEKVFNSMKASGYSHLKKVLRIVKEMAPKEVKSATYTELVKHRKMLITCKASIDNFKGNVNKNIAELLDSKGESIKENLKIIDLQIKMKKIESASVNMGWADFHELLKADQDESINWKLSTKEKAFIQDKAQKNLLKVESFKELSIRINLEKVRNFEDLAKVDAEYDKYKKEVKALRSYPLFFDDDSTQERLTRERYRDLELAADQLYTEIALKEVELQQIEKAKQQQK